MYANSFYSTIVILYVGWKTVKQLALLWFFFICVIDLLGIWEVNILLLLFGSITTAAVLGIIYSVFSTYQPLPEGFFKYGNYDLRTFQVLMIGAYP